MALNPSWKVTARPWSFMFSVFVQPPPKPAYQPGSCARVDCAPTRNTDAESTNAMRRVIPVLPCDIWRAAPHFIPRSLIVSEALPDGLSPTSRLDVAKVLHPFE